MSAFTSIVIAVSSLTGLGVTAVLFFALARDVIELRRDLAALARALEVYQGDADVRLAQLEERRASTYAGRN